MMLYKINKDELPTSITQHYKNRRIILDCVLRIRYDVRNIRQPVYYVTYRNEWDGQVFKNNWRYNNGWELVTDHQLAKERR